MSKNYIQIKKLMFTQPEVRGGASLPALRHAQHLIWELGVASSAVAACAAAAASAASVHVLPAWPTHPMPHRLCLFPQVLHALLQNLADAVVTYIKYQVRAA